MNKRKMVILIFVLALIAVALYLINSNQPKQELNLDAAVANSSTFADEVKSYGGVMNSKFNPKSKTFDVTYYTKENGEKVRTPITVTSAEYAKYGADIDNAIKPIIDSGSGNPNELHILCGVNNGSGGVQYFTFEATWHNWWWANTLNPGGAGPHCQSVSYIW